MRSYVTWLMRAIKTTQWINYREPYGIHAGEATPTTFSLNIPRPRWGSPSMRPPSFICDRWPLTNGNSAWWRRRTNCRCCATARSRWLSSVRATSYTSMRAPTWTRFSSSTPSTTNPTSPSPTRILSRWVHLSATNSQDERERAKVRSINVVADFSWSFFFTHPMKKGIHISRLWICVQYMPRSRQRCVEYTGCNEDAHYESQMIKTGMEGILIAF